MILDRRGFFGASSLLAGAALSASAGDSARAAVAEKRGMPSEANPSVSEAICAHVAGANGADIDATTIEQAKLRLLDLVGCVIGGQRGEGSRALIALGAAGGGAPEATLFGAAGKVPAREAAMINAVVARTYDFEVMTVSVDGVEVASHHAPTTVMTALAAAERGHAAGVDFLTALIIGDDIAARTLAAAGLDFNDGWDGVPLHATLGATAIAARLSGLDARTTRHAFGLAVDQVSGTVQSIWDGASAWKIQQGTAARNGVYCAELAKAGWSGMADPLMAPFGLYGQFTPGIARPRLLTDRLGRAYHAEAYFKPYPSCAANHPTIECALALRADNRLDPGDIASVRVLLAQRILDLFVSKPYGNGPSAHSEANFSQRFACANALLHGSFRQEHYEPAALSSPALAAMMARVALSPAAADAKGVTIEVTMRDGRVVHGALEGHPRHYPRVSGSTYAEVVAKFRRQVDFAGTVPAQLAETLVKRITAVERERDMADFVQLLSQATGGHTA